MPTSRSRHSPRSRAFRTRFDREADTLARRVVQPAPGRDQGPCRRAAAPSTTTSSRMSAEPQQINILRPQVRAEETEDADGSKLSTQGRGTSCLTRTGSSRSAPSTTGRRKVLEAEMGQPGFLAWYRNPGRASEDSLAIAYKDGKGNWRRMCPDFLFFHGDDAQREGLDRRPARLPPRGRPSETSRACGLHRASSVRSSTASRPSRR